MAWIQWGDVIFIKVAAMVLGNIVHLFAAVFRLVNEKITDAHGLRITVLDPSGDSNCIDEELQVGLPGLLEQCPILMSPPHYFPQIASQNMIRQALMLGVVTIEAMDQCVVGDTVPMAANSQEW